MPSNYESFVGFILGKGKSAIQREGYVRDRYADFFLKLKSTIFDFIHRKNTTSTKPSPTITFANLYRKYNGGFYRERSSDEALMDARIINDVEQGSIASLILSEYVQADNSTHILVNSWLRRGKFSETGARMYAELCHAMKYMDDFNGYAYRSITVPAGVYGKKIKVGSIIADKGIVSAFALPQNAIHWMEFWLEKNTHPSNQSEYIFFLFDESIHKKKASDDLMPDNIIINPGGLFCISEMVFIEGNDLLQSVTMVLLKKAVPCNELIVKDIYSGDIVHLS